jgi:hypothetical protein
VIVVGYTPRCATSLPISLDGTEASTPASPASAIAAVRSPFDAWSDSAVTWTPAQAWLIARSVSASPESLERAAWTCRSATSAPSTRHARSSAMSSRAAWPAAIVTSPSHASCSTSRHAVTR